MNASLVETKNTSSASFTTLAGTALATGLVLFLTVGCSTKNYVRSQTTPLIQQTNELDAKTAADHRAIEDTDARAKAGIASAQAAADTADAHAQAAGQAADTANTNAQQAYNRVDSLSGVVANLDNFKPLADVTVTFGFDKATLTADDKQQLDELATKLQSARFYILELTGGTDSIGDPQYNYQLSQRRADAVANYLQAKYNIPPRKFYLVGIGKDLQVADNATREGRAQNRRVQIRLLTNNSSATAPNGGPAGQ